MSLEAFYANPEHDTLAAVEPRWLDVLVEEVLSKLPSGHYRAVTIVVSNGRTYVLASEHDEDTGAIQGYAHWMLCPVYGQTTFQQLKNGTVYLHDGWYRMQTLTEAVALLNSRIGATV